MEHHKVEIAIEAEAPHFEGLEGLSMPDFKFLGIQVEFGDGSRT